ncbi:MAG: glycosyltransferase family 39 protein [Acidobacteriota bacterium]
MKWNLRLLLVAGFFLAGILTFYGSWDSALMDPDEARYAEASREMIEQKSFIVPIFNYAPRLNKPIFFYWLQIISYSLFGVNEFAARLPSMMAGLGSLLLVFLIARLLCGQLHGNRIGSLSLFICFTNLLYFVFSKVGTLDVVLLFFFTLLIYFFLKAEASRIQSKGLHVILLFASLGFAFLTKGPVGVVLPFLIVMFYLLLRRFLFVPERSSLSSPFSWKSMLAGLAVFLAIVAPWGFVLMAKVGVSNVISLIQTETALRYFIGFDHPQPFYFYIPLFLAGFFPWSAFFFVAGYRKIRSALGKLSFQGEDPFLERRQDLFLLIWFAIPIIFFSFSGSKLPGYILPALPPASIIIASEWHRSMEKAKAIKRNWLLISGFLIAVVVLLAFLISGFLILGRHPDFRTLLFFTFYTIVLFLLLIAMNIVLPQSLRSSYLAGSTVVFGILFFMGMNLFAMPEIQKIRSARDLALGSIRKYEGSSLISYRYQIPSLVFYSRRKVELARNEEELVRLAGELARPLIIVNELNFIGMAVELKEKLEVQETAGEFILLTPKREDPPGSGGI